MSFRYILTAASILIMLSSVISADTTITNTTLGISAYLPDNWVATPAGDTAIYLSDTTYTYRSQIAIKKHAINTTEFPTAKEWTRAHFIAYLLVAQYSFDPFGAVLYYDSSATSKQDSLWAPEAFTEFYSLDTLLDSWNEYMRYTESGSIGYELYAIGDTADMRANVGMYAGIIQMVKFNNKVLTQSAFPRQSVTRTTLPLSPTSKTEGIFDLSGKRLPIDRRVVNGVYYQSVTRALRLNVR